MALIMKIMLRIWKGHLKDMRSNKKLVAFLMLVYLGLAVLCPTFLGFFVLGLGGGMFFDGVLIALRMFAIIVPFYFLMNLIFFGLRVLRKEHQKSARLKLSVSS